jgi:NTP pyrophosphatase (non-canonical NTP hydrolase)
MSSMVDLWKWQKRIGYWCKQTFPDNTPQTIEAHFQEETQELRRALFSCSTEAVGEEIADCIILLLSLADELEINASEHVAKKFSEVVKQKWELDPEKGYHKRVK